VTNPFVYARTCPLTQILWILNQKVYLAPPYHGSNLVANNQTGNATFHTSWSDSNSKNYHELIRMRVLSSNSPSKEIGQLSCPSCKQHHETPKHLLWCDTPTCIHLRIALQAKLVTIFTKDQIDPHIYQMWWLGLTTLNNPNDHHIGLYPLLSSKYTTANPKLDGNSYTMVDYPNNGCTI